MRITEYLTLTAGAIGLGAILAGCSGVANSDSIDQKVKNAPKTEQRARHQPVTHQTQHTNSRASTKGASGNGYDGPSYEELIKKSGESIQNQDYKSGLMFAKEAMQLRPNDSTAYSNIATAQIHLGDFDAAIRTSIEAHYKFTEDSMIIRNLGHAYRKKGDYENAIKWLEKSLTNEYHKPTEKWISYLRKKL